jgi:hypothetical protein
MFEPHISNTTFPFPRSTHPLTLQALRIPVYFQRFQHLIKPKMFAFNDSPFTGKIDDPLHLKHASAVQTPLPELFTGEPESIYRFRKDATMHITKNGLKRLSAFASANMLVQPPSQKSNGTL